jgi:hypothetical protein
MRLQTVNIVVAICLMLPAIIPAQGLFENAGNDSSGTAAGDKQSKSFDVSGYVKGALFGGRDNADSIIVSGSYAQAALKLNAEKSGIGRAFAEVRLNAGYDRGSPFAALDVREAWGDVSPGPFDIKLGRQIISWGRADAINPTNNITPKDETVLSSEFDDARLGNELLQVKAKIRQLSIQGIWVPCYRPDVLPLSGAKIPVGIIIADPVYPDFRLTNGGYALRLEYNGQTIDGSVSYFNGYATLPGFDFAFSQTGLSLIPRAYRMHAAGADFSTTIGSFGLRGEAAVKYPFDDYNDNSNKDVYIPSPYAQYVLGLDKSIGNWSVLIQYSGLYVIDFKKIEVPMLTNPYDPAAQAFYASALAAAEMKRLNRLFTGTADEVSHSLTGNIQWNTLYETLHLKIAGMYDFTTKDYGINPSVSYDIADAINLSVGGHYLNGPENNLNNMISNLMSFVYTELKWSF